MKRARVGFCAAVAALSGCPGATSGVDAGARDATLVDAADAELPHDGTPVDVRDATLDARAATPDAGVTLNGVVVSVDPDTDLGPVNRDVFGANFEYIGAAVPEIEPFVSGLPVLRFPGGDDVSRFDWTASDVGTCAEPRWTWPAFARLAAGAGAGVMLETNLLLDAPDRVAGWYADARARGLRVPWVEIGNEAWGEWDAGYRSADLYARDVRAAASALRAFDPSARVVLEVGTQNYDAWNRAAIRQSADVIDAIDYHFYPNKDSSPDPVLVAANADGVQPLVARLRAMLRDEAPARADAIRVIVGEYDGANDAARFPPVPQGVSFAVWNMADALFYGAAVGEMLDAGVAAAMYYELQGYRYGGTGGNACLPADYRVHRPKELVQRLWVEHFGERLLPVRVAGSPSLTLAAPARWDGISGEVPVLRAYASASATADGAAIRVILVNRSPADDVPITLDLGTFAPGSQATVWTVAGDAITATNENVGGPADAVRVETATVPAGAARLALTVRAHSVNALEVLRGP